MSDSLIYEINHLRTELSIKQRRIIELEEMLSSEIDRHATTKYERDELKRSRERAYDAYVQDPHEGYVLSEDYDDLQALINRYEAIDVYVIEKRVREDWFTNARELFADGEQIWQIVDHNGRPSKVAILSKNAIFDLPKLDIGWEARCKHLLTGKVLKHVFGTPYSKGD